MLNTSKLGSSHQQADAMERIAVVMKLIICLSLFIVLPTKATLSGHYYIQNMPLDIEEQFNHGCIRLEPSAEDNIIKCALLCSEDDSCQGISLNSSSHCFTQQQCPNLIPKGYITNSGHRYMVKSETPFTCSHDGVWREEEDRCDCKYGWTGKYCDTMAKICADLRYSGYSNGIHSVYLDLRNDTTSPVRVRCRINPSNGYSYAMVTYNTGDNDYNKTYADFVNGFGDDQHSSYFVGLEAMYLLNRAGYRFFQFNVELESDAVYLGRFVITMSSSTNGYAVKVTHDLSYSLGDTHGFSMKGKCFHPLQDTPFSTWDSDNDNDSDNNCAARAGTGWWFSGCNVTCNLLGRWYGSATNTASEEVVKVAGIDLGVFNSSYVRIRWFMK